MLYSNKKIEAVEKTMDFGPIYQVGMEEIGRGRKFMALTCPKGTKIEHSDDGCILFEDDWYTL